MATSKTLTIFASLLSVLAICQLCSAQPKGVGNDLPQDVIAFIGRRASCHDLASKASEPVDAKQMDSLKCTEVSDDELVLRCRYAEALNVLKALDSAWVKIVQRLPISGTIEPAR